MVTGELAQTWGGKLLMALATATFLGAGSTVISNKLEIVALHHQVGVALEATKELKETNKQLMKLTTNLAILNDRAIRREEREEARGE